MVTSFRAPSKSRGKDFSCALELVDEDERGSIKLVIFGSESGLPKSCPVGAVLCLKKVEVAEYGGHAQLKGHSLYTYWGILEKTRGGSISVSASNDTLVTLSDADKQRGKTLIEWVETTNLVPGVWVWFSGDYTF